MTYTVIWTPQAEQHLASVWIAAADRSEVAAAAYELERDLKRDPLEQGESRQSSVERVILRVPLGLSFSVVVDDMKVYVTAVWLVG